MGSLAEYRKKRRFGETPEPAGKVAPAHGRSFVVQKHAATRLHYDFRLEIEGVLKSWAVPKGPSLNPAEKRLAMETEDHPLDYGGFEGTIPAGNYGAGTVMLWDNGTFEMEGPLSATAQYQRGELKFALHGHKLRGSFVLVKIRGRAGGKGREWLLIKHKDAAVDPNWNVDEHDGSVTTGRTLDDIASGLPGAKLADANDAAALEGARKAAMPAKITPTLATLADKPFSDPEWLFEIKWDGERVLAYIRDGKLELRSRTARDITSEYPELDVLSKSLGARRAIVDGEIVALNAEGHSDFQKLQNRFGVSRPSPKLLEDVPVVIYLFDILYCDGYDLRAAPLIERKKFLKQILEPAERVRFSDHQMEHGEALFDLARQRDLEGIVAKQARSPYPGRRTPLWLKFKTTLERDAVVGGWTAPRGSREHFGALQLGLYQGGALQFIGGVGSGFSEESQRHIQAQLSKLATPECPFAKRPQTREKASWVRPLLVARVKYSGWTADKNLRQPVFLGLREDIDPKECVLEDEAMVSAQKAKAAPPSGEAVLTSPTEIEKELFHGQRENVLIEIEGRRLRLTNLNKIYFPEEKYTKRHLLAHYYRVAPYILPFLEDRPLVLRRYPNGIAAQPFFQKDAGEGFPDWMKTVPVYSEGKDKDIHYFIANDLASLLYLTNLGCIDHNPLSTRSDDPEHPDYFFCDLDPTEGAAFSTVVALAKALYEKLHALGLSVFVKTSGGRGMHLYIPVERRYTFDQGRNFLEVIARLLAAEHPKWVTLEVSVRKRAAGTVRLDADQNAHGQSLASVYSVRAWPQAPVSTPLAPAELKPALRPEQWNIRTLPARMKKRGDLWADFWHKRQRLDHAIELLAEQVLHPKRR